MGGRWRATTGRKVFRVSTPFRPQMFITKIKSQYSPRFFWHTLLPGPSYPSHPTENGCPRSGLDVRPPILIHAAIRATVKSANEEGLLNQDIVVDLCFFFAIVAVDSISGSLMGASQNCLCWVSPECVHFFFSTAFLCSLSRSSNERIVFPT